MNRKALKSNQQSADPHRGAPNRYKSRGVLRMPGAGGCPLPNRHHGDGDNEEAVQSAAHQQLHTLLQKQLDTSATSIQGSLVKKREFAPAVEFRPLSAEVRGLHTLSQYQDKELDYDTIDRLRQLGLSAEEIELKLIEDGALEAPLTKRSKYTAHPQAQRDRIQALQEKISERQSVVSGPVRYTGTVEMSRHAMEVERSLFRESSTGKELQHLTVQDSSRRNKMAYPAKIMPAGADQNTDVEVEEVESREAVKEDVRPLPVEVIARNRLTVAEIRALPRFRTYSIGEPSKVLFVKNLDPKVSEDDLKAVFYGNNTKPHPQIRLLTGRMHGQAFVEFSDEQEAVNTLETVNGYKIRDRPIVVSYGRKKIENTCKHNS